ncbi:hypothetical protein HDV01_000298 [Terramyces sp. JEL0728]|nr:hypothetical protein HDV01_000298 [Terramyces sp. JEL0728]
MAGLNNVEFKGRKADIHYSLPKEGDREQNQGSVSVEFVGTRSELLNQDLYEYMSKFGEIQSIRDVEGSKSKKIVSFFDSRCVPLVLDQIPLNSSFKDGQLHASQGWDEGHEELFAKQSSAKDNNDRRRDASPARDNDRRRDDRDRRDRDRNDRDRDRRDNRNDSYNSRYPQQSGYQERLLQGKVNPVSIYPLQPPAMLPNQSAQGAPIDPRINQQSNFKPNEEKSYPNQQFQQQPNNFGSPKQPSGNFPANQSSFSNQQFAPPNQPAQFPAGIQNQQFPQSANTNQPYGQNANSNSAQYGALAALLMQAQQAPPS